MLPRDIPPSDAPPGERYSRCHSCGEFPPATLEHPRPSPTARVARLALTLLGALVAVYAGLLWAAWVAR